MFSLRRLMDARVKPAHDIGCVVGSFELREHSFSQRSAAPGFCFSDAQVRPSSCFPSLSQ
jgi:hypothetical protein